MAELTVEETQPQTISSSYSWYKVAIAGVLLGILFWGLSLVLDQYIIGGWFCPANAGAAVCANSLSVSGNIATVLVAVAGTFALVRLKVFRPLLAALASGVVMWGLADWTRGLVWIEAIVWSAGLYALGYSLFAWITRYSRLTLVIIAVLAVVIIARIVTVLG